MLQLIVPAYNEELRLPETLRNLRDYVLRESRVLQQVEVIVVDNASTDRTAEVAAELDSPGLPIRVVHCSVRGKGAAVRAGVAASDAELVGFMDADGATSMEALDEAWRLVTLGSDVAIGSRAVDGAQTMARHSWMRERGAQFYRNLAGRIVPGVSDTQCGFKLMRGDLARRVFACVATTGFSFDVELLMRLRNAGASIAEFPVRWTDVPGSTFAPARHGIQSFTDLASIAWRLRDLGRTAPVTPLTPLRLSLESVGDVVAEA
jgi:glycosyltransferase involved in cell wall biosynthesis